MSVSYLFMTSVTTVFSISVSKKPRHRKDFSLLSTENYLVLKDTKFTGMLQESRHKHSPSVLAMTHSITTNLAD